MDVALIQPIIDRLIKIGVGAQGFVPFLAESEIDQMLIGVALAWVVWPVNVVLSRSCIVCFAELGQNLRQIERRRLSVLRKGKSHDIVSSSFKFPGVVDITAENERIIRRQPVASTIEQSYRLFVCIRGQGGLDCATPNRGVCRISLCLCFVGILAELQRAGALLRRAFAGAGI